MPSPRTDFLAVISRPDFPSGSGPVGDYFGLRRLIERHPDWNAVVLELNAGPVDVDWDGDRFTVTPHGGPTVDLARVGTALYLPICLEVEETLLSSSRSVRWPRFEAEQWRPVTALFEQRLDVSRCINRPGAVRRANNKLLQYELLRAAGFELPPTAMSRRWPDAGPLGSMPTLVAKNVSEGGWRSPTEFSPAHLADPNDPVEDWPVLWQQPLQSDTELRLYVMGEQVTAVHLDRHPEELDVRATNDGRPTCRIGTVPSQWEARAVALAGGLGLDYAVIDAIPVGDTLHVLEVNANGVWWFLPADVADVLEDRFHRWIEGWVTAARR